MLLFYEINKNLSLRITKDGLEICDRRKNHFQVPEQIVFLNNKETEAVLQYFSQQKDAIEQILSREIDV